MFQRLNAEDVNHAVNAASEACKKWQLVLAPRRAEMLYKAAEILIARKEEYAQLMTREIGKVIKETRGDVQETVDCGYYTAGEGAEAQILSPNQLTWTRNGGISGRLCE